MAVGPPTFAVPGRVGQRGRQHRGPPERSLQVVVLLGQLLQGFLEADALLPLCLQGLLPALTVGLG